MNSNKRSYKRGDMFYANLGSGTISVPGEHVQGGYRPVVVIQNNLGNFFSDTLIVVPLTSRIEKKPSLPTHYVFEPSVGLKSTSMALGEQITTIAKKQCKMYLGRLDMETVDEIHRVACIAIGADIPLDMEAP